MGFGKGERPGDPLRHQQRFQIFHKMYMEREFRLVLCADVLDCIVECVVQSLERIVKAEMARGGLDYLLCGPLIISEIRSPRTRPCDAHAGGTGTEAIHASAL